MNGPTRPVLAALVGLAVLAAGCEDEVVMAPGGAAPPPTAPTQPGAEGGRERAEVPALDFGDGAFAEADTRNRNPFRSFLDDFRMQAPAVVQRRVTMPDVSVEQMHLVAIVTRLPQPRAMLVDPHGVGHVVKRGDYVGRAEVVQAGGPEGMPVTLNWRVDRIRANEVVLTREDPTAPDRPPLTRVIALYEDSELTAARLDF
jgi:type IV pilus assembly protein PilP